MPLDLFLRDQAIRMRRTKWQNPWDLADELFLILRSIPVETTGQISIIPPGGGDPTDFPPIDDLNIPPFDLDLPEDGINQPEVEQSDDGKRTTKETYFWHRAVFPGLITSQETGVNYNTTLFPNGNLESLAVSKFTRPPGTPDGPVTKQVVARLTDASLAGTIPANTWTFIFWIAEYLLVEEIIRDDDGRELSHTTELTVLQQEFIFNAPGSGGGGKVARVTTTITARSGTTAGQGRAILYDFGLPEDDPQNPGQQTPPTLTPADEVDVFNMVTSEIAAGADKFIQVKRIDNAWFIDVEDCAA